MDPIQMYGMLKPYNSSQQYFSKANKQRSKAFKLTEELIIISMLTMP